MRVFNGFEHTAYIPRPVVTIGSYDGVHRGHREILSHLEALARARKGESVVVTFHPHPRLVLGRGEGLRLLTTLPEKLELLEQAGIDNVIVAPFTESFSRLGAEEFIRDYHWRSDTITTSDITSRAIPDRWNAWRTNSGSGSKKCPSNGSTTGK